MSDSQPNAIEDDTEGGSKPHSSAATGHAVSPAEKGAWARLTHKLRAAPPPLGQIRKHFLLLIRAPFHARKQSKAAREEQAKKRTAVGTAMLSLSGFSAIAFGLAAIANAVCQHFKLNSTLPPILLIASAIAGLYVMLWQAEEALAIFHPFGSTKIFLAAFGGLAVYFAHGLAADEVNKMFSVDSSALPHTTAAATVFKLVTSVQWVFWITCVLGLLGVAWFGMVVDDEDRTLKSLSAMISSLAITIMIPVFLSDGSEAKAGAEAKDGPRQKLLYRLAMQTDFDSKFNCASGTVGTDSVLFLGPEQRLAIIAPEGAKVSGVSIPLPQDLQVPKTFAQTECNALASHGAELPSPTASASGPSAASSPAGAASRT